MNLRREKELGEEIHQALLKFIRNLEWMSQRVMAKGNLLTVEDEIALAAEKCVPVDDKSWDLSTVEVECTTYINQGNGVSEQGTTDLVLVNPAQKKFRVADWKRVGYLPDQKVERYMNSFQPVMYLDHWKSEFPDYQGEFEFRFLVAGKNDTSPHVESLIVTKLDDEGYSNNRLDELWLEVKKMELSREYNVWTRREHSCYNWGEACPFLKDCWQKEKVPEPLDSILVSQSLVNTYIDCPRKYYNLLKEAEGEDYHTTGKTGNPAILGQMFHLGMAMVYNEVKRRKQLS